MIGPSYSRRPKDDDRAQIRLSLGHQDGERTSERVSHDADIVWIDVGQLPEKGEASERITQLSAFQ